DDLAGHVAADAELLAQNGTIAACAGGREAPVLPFRVLASRNAALHRLDGGGLSLRAQLSAARDLNAALKAGWPGFEIADRIPLSRIADAHDRLENGRVNGCVAVVVRSCEREGAAAQ
ncbi:MAG TPA: hypothetical protein VK973_00615, partial [Arenicellales bacterium]|nr:hypothetical protein [Arenicellales bacterium]